MNHIPVYKILFLTIIVTLLSCTHNNGDIGPLFGQWKLTEILINDKPDQNYGGNIFFAFQNDVTNMRMVCEHNETIEKYGHWEQNGDILLLIYDDPNYLPLPETYFNTGVNTCEIITLNSKELILKRKSDNGTYTYKFKKW